MDRREFLLAAGSVASAGVLAGPPSCDRSAPADPSETGVAPEEGHWAEVRSRFLVDPAKVQLAGIVAFDVEGLSAQQAVDRLADRGIIGSVSPYPRPHVRFSPALLNTEDEIERALQAVREVA